MTTPAKKGPKLPQVRLKLTGEDGNAFFILGRARQAMRRANVHEKAIAEFFAEAQSGDYNHLLATCTEWFTCS